ncbi:MAG: type I-C CRISPR-associated protein Cas5 [Deltaproteobacteria bacterium]|nr:type I-C CRISPR-associated protein Cas5 [Deltaproteobacteria bacterium]
MKGFCLEVSGLYACFTRPEMKVERVSYDVITPSAARAIFDAILWKPAIFWHVKKIEVLAPIRWISVRRNEVGKVASTRSAGIFIEDHRRQRAGLFLRDVKYRLHAEFELLPPGKRPKPANRVPAELIDGEESKECAAGESPTKYLCMFERRAGKGQCFNQPYLGCREFSAAFRLVDPKVETDKAIPDSRDLGWMLYDMDFTNPADPKPLFFDAKLENGVVAVPDRRNREEVRG